MSDGISAPPVCRDPLVNVRISVFWEDAHDLSSMLRDDYVALARVSGERAGGASEREAAVCRQVVCRYFQPLVTESKFLPWRAQYDRSKELNCTRETGGQ